MLRLLLVFTLLGWVSPAWAGRVFLQLEPPRLEAGQTGTLTVLMVDDRTRGAPQFEVPDGLLLSFDGSYRQFKQDGFRKTDIHGFRYRITAIEAGTYTIGPFELPMSSGQQVLSNAAKLVVSPRSHGAAGPELDVTASFDVEEAWEGQMVVYSHSLVARLPVLGVQWRLPRFEGLTVPQSASPSSSEYFIDDADGARLTVNEGAVPLIASGTGDRSAAGAMVQARVASGDGRVGLLGTRQYRTVTAASQTSSLKVFPLPDPPDGFSGLVGDFQFNSSMDRTRVPVGASVAWTLEVAGNGTLDGWKPAKLDDGLPIGLYDNDDQIEARVQDGTYQAFGRYERVIVPLEPGVLDLPDMEIITFSPSKAEYQTHKVRLGELVITKGREQAVEMESWSEARPEDVEAGAPVDFRRHFSWGAATTYPLAPVGVALSGVAAAPALWVFLLSVVGRVRSRVARRAAERVRPPTASERLVRLPDDPEDRLALLDAALRQALATRVGVPVIELDRAVALTQLPDDLAQRVREAGQALDRARFAGGAGVDVAALKALVAELERP